MFLARRSFSRRERRIKSLPEECSHGAKQLRISRLQDSDCDGVGGSNDIGSQSPRRIQTRAPRLALLPVFLHQLLRPIGLNHRLTREKFPHHRFDVQNRSPIDRVQTTDHDGPVLAAYQPGHAHSDSIRAVFSPLGKNTHLGPVRIVSWMTGPRLNPDLGHTIKMKHDFHMGKRFNPGERVTRNVGTKLNSRLHRAPIIIADADS